MWKRQAGLFGMVVGGLLLLIIGVWVIADFFSVLADPMDNRESLRNAGIVVAGLVASGFAVWRGLILEKQTKVSRDQYTRSLDRDYADLFTKAVEQLGTTREIRVSADSYEYKPNIEVRLGAIYALERVSRDSEPDHIAVMETLCAYVRENAPGKDRQVSVEAEPKPRADIQAALTVMGRRSEGRIAHEATRDYQLDLRGSLLRKADLRKARLQSALLSEAFLEGAYLREANLTEADLGLANLTKADLWKANLTKADLWLANLKSARLASVRIDFVDASLADFTDAKDFSQENIESYFGCAGTVLPDYATGWRPRHWHPERLEEWDERSEAYGAWKAACEAGERPPWVDEADWSGWPDA